MELYNSASMIINYMSLQEKKLLLTLKHDLMNGLTWERTNIFNTKREFRILASLSHEEDQNRIRLMSYQVLYRFIRMLLGG